MAFLTITNPTRLLRFRVGDRVRVPEMMYIAKELEKRAKLSSRGFFSSQ